MRTKRPPLRRLTVRSMVILLAMLGAAPLGAHHSFAMFDMQTQMTVEGTVMDFQWTNPHVWIELAVDEDGKQVQYSFEGSSPNNLIRRGWVRATLKPGDRIRLVYNPLKNGIKGGAYVRAVFANGEPVGG